MQRGEHRHAIVSDVDVRQAGHQPRAGLELVGIAVEILGGVQRPPWELGHVSVPDKVMNEHAGGGVAVPNDADQRIGLLEPPERVHQGVVGAECQASAAGIARERHQRSEVDLHR